MKGIQGLDLECPVYDDPSFETSQARARVRMAKICENASEMSVVAYAPQEARTTVRRPGFKDDTYGNVD